MRKRIAQIVGLGLAGLGNSLSELFNVDGVQLAEHLDDVLELALIVFHRGEAAQEILVAVVVVVAVILKHGGVLSARKRCLRAGRVSELKR